MLNYILFIVFISSISFASLSYSESIITTMCYDAVLKYGSEPCNSKNDFSAISCRERACTGLANKLKPSICILQTESVKKLIFSNEKAKFMLSIQTESIMEQVKGPFLIERLVLSGPFVTLQVVSNETAFRVPLKIKDFGMVTDGPIKYLGDLNSVLWVPYAEFDEYYKLEDDGMKLEYTIFRDKTKFYHENTSHKPCIPLAEFNCTENNDFQTTTTMNGEKEKLLVLRVPISNTAIAIVLLLVLVLILILVACIYAIFRLKKKTYYESSDFRNSRPAIPTSESNAYISPHSLYSFPPSYHQNDYCEVPNRAE